MNAIAIRTAQTRAGLAGLRRPGTAECSQSPAVQDGAAR
jgi:transcription elongation factor